MKRYSKEILMCLCCKKVLMKAMNMGPVFIVKEPLECVNARRLWACTIPSYYVRKFLKIEDKFETARRY